MSKNWTNFCINPLIDLVISQTSAEVLVIENLIDWYWMKTVIGIEIHKKQNCSVQNFATITSSLFKLSDVGRVNSQWVDIYLLGI